MRHILLDMDGVFYDWIGEVCRVLGVDTAQPKYRQTMKKDPSAFDKMVGRSIIDRTVASLGSDFWVKIPMFPWANDLYKALKPLGEITFLTDPRYYLDSPKGKMIAIRRDFKTDSIMIGSKKHLCAVPHSILIDDKVENIKKFRKASGAAFLWPNQYKLVDGDIDVKGVIAKAIEAVNKV